MTVRTPELADTLVDGITEGTPLRQLCREQGVAARTIYNWMDDDAEFAARIAQARARGFDQIAEEAYEIADDRTDDPASRRIRVEARLKLLAKWDPKRYGDKLALGGAEDLPALKVQPIPVERLSGATLRELAAQAALPEK